MAQRTVVKSSSDTQSPRSAEMIKREIAAEKELISETVDLLGDKLHEKMNWRSYVTRHPALSLMAAAGMGFLISRVVARRASPAEEFAQALSDRFSIGPTRDSPVTFGLLAVLTQAVAQWITNPTVASESRRESGNGGERPKEATSETQPAYHNPKEDRLI
jgi:hypothetical protein